MFLGHFHTQFIAGLYYLSSLFKLSNDLKWMKNPSIIHQIPLAMLFFFSIAILQFPYVAT